MSAQKLLNLIFLVAVSTLVFSVWCCCVFVWLSRYLSRLKKLKERLGLAAGSDAEKPSILILWRDVQQDSIKSASALKLTFKEKLRCISADAGWNASLQVILLGIIGAMVLSFIISAVLFHSVLLGIVLAVLIIVIFYIYTQSRINKRVALFERQLVDALGVAARSLRAGHPLTGAFQLISEEVDDPIKSVFYRICQEQSLGLDFKGSMRKVARLTRNAEMKLFATAVAIQLQSGGNLAELMDSLALVVRGRIRLNRKVRVLTAQTKLSARILIALPIILFFVINFISPEYMKPLYYTTEGKYMLVGMFTSVLFGWLIMRKLSVLKF